MSSTDHPAAGRPSADHRAAVLGRPIGHSLSPVLHRAAYRALGLTDWSYQRIECGADELPGFLAGLGPEWVGLSLTMPLKRVALDLADEVSAVAHAVGAANTLLLSEGSLSEGSLSERHCRADNTDVPGMVDALTERGVTELGVPVVLGAGGTAQAALAALRQLGVEVVTVVVRDRARAAPLEETAERLRLELEFRSWGDERALTGAGLVVSTVPAGAADRFGARWPGPVPLFDVVYAPWPTRLAEAARVAGSVVVSGADLLLHQAAHQVRLMTGLPAPVEAMRAALTETGRRP